MHDTSVARLYAHFSFTLAPRMGGPAGVDEKVSILCSEGSFCYVTCAASTHVCMALVQRDLGYV
jgi:hypothetical protein